MTEIRGDVFTCLLTYLLTFTYLLTYLLTPRSRFLLEKSTGSQLVKKFLAFCEKPNIYYRIHKCPPSDPIPSQLDPLHTPTSHFLKIHLNIILPSIPGVSPVVSLPQVSPPKTCICLPSSPYMLHARSISFLSILSPE